MKNRVHFRNVHPGTTLLELSCALVLIGILSMLGTPSYLRARDGFAVRAARDGIVAASARTQAYAVNHGGASLAVDAAAHTLRVLSRDGAIDETSTLPPDLRIVIQFDGAHVTTATIPYDALGIGRIASRTISLQSGRAAGGITFSSYGRPRAW